MKGEGDREMEGRREMRKTARRERDEGRERASKGRKEGRSE